ncbi:S-layer homology domain-containing protein [Bacillus sp. JJ722]|uniref:S-layer homology domain-containing protein n=1 Tax=Bacillus sp. JJ722 TaxID=3122973 RepID=UPI00300006AE
MKKTTSIMLLAILFSSLFLFNEKAEASSFSDINSHWAEKEMEYIFQKGIIKGYSDGTFKPNETITRAQAAIMIGRAMGINGDKSVNTRFPDVDASVTGSGYIYELEKIDVITGYGDGTYRPYEHVNRGDAIIHLMRSSIAPSHPTKPYPKNPFKDVSSKQMSGDFVITAYHHGIVSGYADQTFRPYQLITRAEFSVFMARSLQST